ncbi:MAG: TolB family protein [Myxococcota bacterium]
MSEPPTPASTAPDYSAHTLIFHQNLPGAAPALCSMSAHADATPTCRPQSGTFAGPRKPDANAFVVIEVIDDAEGHRERLSLWSMNEPELVPITLWTGAVRNPTWTPDGTALLATSDADGPSDLWTIPVPAGEPTPLSPHPFGTFEPDVHPDGSKVVFASSRDGNAELYELALTPTAEPVRLTDDPADDMAPKWSADGSTLAFRSNRGERMQVWTQQRGHAAKPIAPTLMGSHADAVWAPNSPHLAIVWGPSPDRSQIAIVHGQTGAIEHRIGTDALAVQQPAWSPDGKRLAFTCQRPQERPAVCVSRADGSDLQVIAKSDRLERWLPRWLD